MSKPRNNSDIRFEIIRRVRLGDFKTDLAKEFGFSLTTIYEWTKGIPQANKKQGINPRYYSKELRAQVIQRFEKGEAKVSIAKDLNIAPGTVHEWTKHLGLKSVRNPSRKPYSEPFRAEVIRRIEAGEPKVVVAESMDVGKNVVMQWAKGKGHTKPIYSEQVKDEAIKKVTADQEKITVANSMGISIGTIQNWTKKIKRRRSLTDEDRNEVVRKYEDGVLKKVIANDLGISKSTVGKLTSHVKFNSTNQEVKSRFIEQIKSGQSPIPLTRSLGIPATNYHRWRESGELDILITPDLLKHIYDALAEKISIYKIALQLSVPVHQLRQIKRTAEGKSGALPNKSTYTPDIKLQAAKMVEAGERIRSVAKKIGASYAAVRIWVKEAVGRGEIALSVPANKGDDHQLMWICQKYPELEDWRVPLSEWLDGEERGIGHKLSAISNFVNKYLALQNVPKRMSDVLRRGAALPSLYDELVKVMSPSSAIKQHNTIRVATDWVLINYFSESDDDGNDPIIAPGFRNPFPYINRGGVPQNIRDESVRDVLPYGYIVELREMLAAGPTFMDWKLGQSAIGFETATGSTNSQTDWFEVSEEMLDKKDPNCVWRIRERINKPPVLEMWSPVRWVAVLIKLQTVARTGMVRMLDSGESDTWRYEKNRFVLNTNKLASANNGKLWQQGVFRKNPILDPSQSAILYFNTNKTNDIYKSGPEKGYECPWPMFDSISENPYYWLEQLRNWQEKYNPIDERQSWGNIPAHRSIGPKSKIAKATYPDACFLFRTPEVKGYESFPVANSVVDKAWKSLLKAFDEELARNSVTHPDGSPVRLHQSTNGKTKFPLHGLRVSLITAMVLDGKVQPELMMKIVGHCRLVMLLYYTKPGASQLCDALKDAAQKMDEKKEASILRFLTDVPEQEMLSRVVFIAEDWRTVMPVNPAHRNPAGWLLMHDGICLAGGNTSPLDGDAKIPGCHNGGPLKKASTGEYDPVPGGAMNCNRCRWKAAEKSHGPALVATFNNQAYHLMQEQQTALKRSREITSWKKEKARVESTGAVFTNMVSLKTAERLYESSMVRLADISASIAETYKMILRIKQLPDMDNGGVALAMAGDIATMHAVLEETDSELLQLSGICGDVEIYPDLPRGTAVYRRSQLYDAALMREGMPPFFMQLSEDEQLQYGNAFMRKLAEISNPENPLLGLRTVVSTIDSHKSIEQLLGVKLPDIFSYISTGDKVTIRHFPSGEFSDGEN